MERSKEFFHLFGDMSCVWIFGNKIANNKKRGFLVSWSDKPEGKEHVQVNVNLQIQ